MGQAAAEISRQVASMVLAAPDEGDEGESGPQRMREIRLCSFVTAELDGSVLDGALCLDDFDGDGEDEVAVGTVTGRLSVFKYHASSQAEDRVMQSWR